MTDGWEQTAPDVYKKFIGDDGMEWFSVTYTTAPAVEKVSGGYWEGWIWGYHRMSPYASTSGWYYHRTPEEAMALVEEWYKDR